MKSLKITLLAIFSVVLLTGVNSINDAETITQDTNKDVKQVDIAGIAGDKTKIKPPTNG